MIASVIAVIRKSENVGETAVGPFATRVSRLAVGTPHLVLSQRGCLVKEDGDGFRSCREAVERRVRGSL